jgi:ATP adenylyltransferase/5',5'''-P-1,P-4-tetraphosphate phosphorylase II
MKGVDLSFEKTDFILKVGDFTTMMQVFQSLRFLFLYVKSASGAASARRHPRLYLLA